MTEYDGGHQETRTDLPGPLTRTGALGIGTWALPGKTLSLASVLVFVIVMVFLVHDARFRALLVLPGGVALGFAVVAAGLAWLVLFVCRNRPGRVFPRCWSLILAALTTVIALGCALDPTPSGTPWLHALAIAALAAAVTLIPRVLRVRVDSGWVQRVAPLTMLVILALILPSSCYLGYAVINQHTREIDQHILQLQRWTDEVRDATNFDWSHLQDSPDAAAANVGRLTGLRFPGLLADKTLWRAAVVLDHQDELAAASSELLTAVVDGLAGQRTPKLSALVERAVRWDRSANRWIPSSTFPRASEIVADYHNQLMSRYQELAAGHALAEIPAMVQLEEHTRSKRDELAGHLAAACDTWVDNWVVYQIPDHQQWIDDDRDRMPLANQLQRSLTTQDGNTLPAGDLTKLLNLSLTDTRSLTALAPGCDPMDYSEGQYEYFRLDCYSYAPSISGTGAELRVEMRLVFSSAENASLNGYETPVEVYYLFPLPGGTEEAGRNDDFREEVMTALAAAVRAGWTGYFSPVDRSGSFTAGFVFGPQNDRMRVLTPRIVNLYENQKAVEVRAKKVE